MSRIFGVGAGKYDSNVALLEWCHEYKVWRVGKVSWDITLYGNETLKRAAGMPFDHWDIMNLIWEL